MKRAMGWLTRLKERLAIRILVKSQNITMIAFKDKDCPQIFMAAAPIDPIGFAFYARNMNEVNQEVDPDSMVLERIYHAPDAEQGI